MDLDRQLHGGFRAGQLVVLGARPSMGKTALVLGMAVAAAQRDVPTLYCSLEMSRAEVAERFLAMEGVSTDVQAAGLPERELGPRPTGTGEAADLASSRRRRRGGDRSHGPVKSPPHGVATGPWPRDRRLPPADVAPRDREPPDPSGRDQPGTEALGSVSFPSRSSPSPSSRATWRRERTRSLASLT